MTTLEAEKENVKLSVNCLVFFVGTVIIGALSLIYLITELLKNFPLTL